MTRASHIRGISIYLWEHKYVFYRRPKVRKQLKRQSHRLDRQMAKASLRDLDLSEWTAGEFEIEPILPVTTSATGHTVYVGDAT